MNLVNGIIRIVYYSIIYTALSSRREKGFVNTVTSRGSLRLKERERREENDILSFCSIAFSENGCFPDHTSACFSVISFIAFMEPPVLMTSSTRRTFLPRMRPTSSCER